MSGIGRGIPELRGFLVARLPGKSGVSGEENSGATGFTDGTKARESADGWGGRCEGDGSGNSEIQGFAGVMATWGILFFGGQA